MHELTQALRTLETGVCAVTGMPGVGKSALTAEAVHQVATNERERLHLFPDGIATFSGTGRRGVRGLIALLQDIIGVFSLAEPSTSKATDAALISSGVTRSSGDDRLVSLSTIHTNGTSSNGHEAMLDLLEVDLFLLAVLARMWQQEQYPLVVRFLTGLWPLTGRLDNYEQGERLLQWGIGASQRVQDQYHLAFFLSRLGKLEIHHGQLTSAKHTLEQSLAIAESLGRSKSLWGALGDLAHIAHILDDVGAARGFAETYVQRAQEADNPVSSSIARYIRGFYARLEGSLDKAYDDVCSSLCLLSALGPDIPFCKDPFSMPVRAELARIEGDYARSKGYTEAGVSLAQITEPPYIIADLLYDQACFAHQQGIMDDARSLALRVVDMAGQMGTPHLHARAVTLLRLIPG